MFVFSKVNKSSLVSQMYFSFHHVTTHKSRYPPQLLKWKGAIFRLCVVACFFNVGELFSDKMKKKLSGISHLIIY